MDGSGGGSSRREATRECGACGGVAAGAAGTIAGRAPPACWGELRPRGGGVPPWYVRFAWVRRLLRDGREGADSAVLSTRSDAEARELRPPPSPLHPRATPPGTPPPDGPDPVNARGARERPRRPGVVERVRIDTSKVLICWIAALCGFRMVAEDSR